MQLVSSGIAPNVSYARDSFCICLTTHERRLSTPEYKRKILGWGKIRSRDSPPVDDSAYPYLLDSHRRFALIEHGESHKRSFLALEFSIFGGTTNSTVIYFQATIRSLVADEIWTNLYLKLFTRT